MDIKHVLGDSNLRCRILQTSSIIDDDLNDWISTPPRFTVLRVNTLINTRNELVQKLKEHLIEQYTGKRRPKPEVLLPDELDDVIVLRSPESSFLANSVVPQGKQVIVGSLCGSAILRGANVFAPGVLGAPMSLKVGNRVSIYADVDGKCLRGSAKNFEDIQNVIFVGNGIAKMSRDDLFKTCGSPSGIAIEVDAAVYDCPSLNEFEVQGLGMLQNLPSVLCSHILDPLCSDVILDMCAAPGGKTTHIACKILQRAHEEVGEKTGYVVAIDKSAKKVELLRENCKRMCLDNVKCFAYDSTKIVEEAVENDNKEGPPFPLHFFDKVLLDAPCSALGQRPQFRNFMSDKEFLSFPKLQKKLLKQAHALLKPGGTLVYSTCSPSLEENEMNVAWILESFPDMELMETVPKFGEDGIALENFSSDKCKKVQRFPVRKLSQCDSLPTDTIGFFIAKLKKN